MYKHKEIEVLMCLEDFVYKNSLNVDDDAYAMKSINLFESEFLNYVYWKAKSYEDHSQKHQ